MAEEFYLFPEQYQTNVEFLELQNDDDFSGVELLKQGCAKGTKGVQDTYGVCKKYQGCANRSRGVQPCIKMVHLCHIESIGLIQ